MNKQIAELINARCAMRAIVVRDRKSPKPRHPRVKRAASARAIAQSARGAAPNYRHGLAGKQLTLTDDEIFLFQSHLRTLNAEYVPAGAVEEKLVRRLAEHEIRVRRLGLMQQALPKLARKRHDPPLHSYVGRLFGCRDVWRKPAEANALLAAYSAKLHKQQMEFSLSLKIAQLLRKSGQLEILRAAA